MDTDLHPITALIVDDEPNASSLLAHLLREYCPYVEIVDTAKNVNEGFEKLEAHQPDLLFIDIETLKKGDLGFHACS